jgi:lysophospholipase L1-like esterase
MDTLSWKKKLLFWFIIAVIPLASVELGFRVYYAHELGSSFLFYGTRLNRERSGDAHSGDMYIKERYFKYHPHQQRYTRDHETGELIRASINSRGFRGAEFMDGKAPHTTRIVTLGASSTFGFHDRDDATYPYQLEQLLNRDANGLDSVEVINLGIPHLDSGQILALFEEEALPLHPDIVTFYEGINDSWRSPVLYQREREPKGHVAVRQKLRRISFLRGAFQWARAHVVTVALADAFMKTRHNVTFHERDVDKHMRGKSENFLDHVAAINRACKRRGILFIVASQQAKSRLVDREDIRGVTYGEEHQLVLARLARTGGITRRELYFLTHNVLMRDLENWCNANGVPFVDVIAAMDDRRDCLVSWVHLNREGNAIVAQALAHEILARTGGHAVRTE